MPQRQKDHLVVGPLRLDLRTRSLRYRDQEVEIQAQPFAVLVVLAGAIGEYVSGKEILERVWEERAGHDSSKDALHQAVRRLRRALRDCPDVRIESRPKKGYRLHVPVHSGHWRRPIVLLGGALSLTLLATLAVRTLDPPPDTRPRAPSLAASEFAAGMVDYRMRRFKQARSHFRTAIESDSTFALAYWGRSVCEAFWNISEAVKSDATRANALAARLPPPERALVRSWNSQVQGNTAEATAILERAIERYPGESELLFQMATIYWLHRQEYETAGGLYLQAVALDSTDARSWNALAYCQRSLGNYEGAIAAAHQYARLCSTDANPWDSLGDMFRRVHSDSALWAYRKAVSIDAEEAFFSVAKIAEMELSRAHFDSARSALGILVQVGDAHYQSIQRRFSATIPVVRGRYDAGVTALQAAIDVDHEKGAESRWTSTTYAVLASVFEALGDPERALELYRKADAMMGPGYPLAPARFGFDLVRLLLELGRETEARSELDALPTPDQVPNSRWAWPRLASEAVLRLHQGDAEGAIFNFRRALETGTDREFELRVRLAEVLASNGEEAVALHQLEQLLRNPPGNWIIAPITYLKTLRYAGDLAVQRGEVQLARFCYKQWLAFVGDTETLATQAHRVRNKLGALPGAKESNGLERDSEYDRPLNP